jgi:RND superfamily putative drug exporter
MGLESGRLITGAAAIMCVVFLAFELASVVIQRPSESGTVAIAIAIDATIVRILIVPSVMRILGRASWWAPRPLTGCTGGSGLENRRRSFRIPSGLRASP